MQAHQYPMPLWNAEGKLEYCPNANQLEDFHRRGFRDRVVTTEFPRAIHGPNGQSMSIPDKADGLGRSPAEQLEAALKNGWSLTPIIPNQKPAELPPSVDRPPVGVDLVKEQDASPVPPANADACTPEQIATLKEAIKSAGTTQKVVKAYIAETLGKADLPELENADLPAVLAFVESQKKA
jgi:hypothetical protein